jgi:DeoR/GlpR family transcriptional regulator of sugar metabolism
VGIGTTAEQFARFLPAHQGLTVVTASLPIASLLGTRSIDVVVLGGAVRQDELTCVGPVAVATLGRYRFDLAVVGAAGLSARWGLTEVDEGDAETQRQAIARAARLMVISDGSKIGSATNVVVGEAARVDVLVTDPSAAGDELTNLAGLGIQVAIAGDGSAPEAPGVPSHART